MNNKMESQYTLKQLKETLSNVETGKFHAQQKQLFYEHCVIVLLKSYLVCLSFIIFLALKCTKHFKWVTRRVYKQGSAVSTMFVSRPLFLIGCSRCMFKSGLLSENSMLAGNSWHDHPFKKHTVPFSGLFEHLFPVCCLRATDSKQPLTAARVPKSKPVAVVYIDKHFSNTLALHKPVATLCRGSSQ